jgi:hypothetical protein
LAMPMDAYYVLLAAAIPIYHHGSEENPCWAEIESV